jgi:hypothetical protein
MVSECKNGKNGALCQITFRHRRRVTFSVRQVLGNDHFCRSCEKLFGRNDAAPGATSASYAKRIMSETVTFPFPGLPRKGDETAILPTGKVIGRASGLRDGLDPLSRLA